MSLALRLATIYRFVRHGLPAVRQRPGDFWTVADLIERQAQKHAARPFVRFEKRIVSYREHNELCNRVAHWGRAVGLSAGDVVALLMMNRPEFLAVWGGLAKLGVTTALLNTNLTGGALAHAIQAAGTRRLIVGSECLEAVLALGEATPPGLEIWGWQDSAEDAEPIVWPAEVSSLDDALEVQPVEGPDHALREGVRAGDPLVYIYTSGTTGLPKAAKMSHLRFATTGLAAVLAGFGSRDTMYCALPLYHSAGGAMAVMAALRSGGTIAVRRKFSAGAFWDDVCRFDATAFQYIGEFCRYLLNQRASSAERAHRLRFCIGNGLRPDIWEEFKRRFSIPRVVEFYGSTEGNVALVNYDDQTGSVGSRPPAIIPAPVLIRYDVETDDHIRGEDGLCIECAPGEIGELVGEIPPDSNQAQGRFEGYTSKQATDEKILRDVRKHGDSWFRTGDLLKCDERGYFYFVDRIGDTFRWKGENVSTQEVAEALSVYPGLRMCNVYGVELGAEGRAGMAAIVLDGEFDGKAFYELVDRSLPPYAAPVFVRLQPEATITGTFKLRKVDLQREGYDPDVVRDPLYVRDEAERSYVPLTPERLAAIRSGERRV